MRLLITGSTGFIGRNFLLQALTLQQQWSEVIAPVRNPEKLFSFLAEEGWQKPPSQLRILPFAPPSWGKHLECDVAVHCAGVLFGRSPADYYAINVEGTLELVRALPESTKIVLLSSQAAGGPTPSNYKAREIGMLDEPLTDYGESKRAMEERCLSDFFGRDIVILRPPMVLGARDPATLPLFQLAARRLRPKPGLAPKQYSFISVKDLCDAVFAVIGENTQTLQQRILYVCYPESITDRDLIECAGKLLGVKGWIFPLPQRLVQAAAFFLDAIPTLRNKIPSLTRDRVREIFPDRWVVNGSQFEKTFHFHCETGLEASLAEALAWYRKMNVKGL